MSETEKPIVRKAAQLVALAHELREEGLGKGDQQHPIFWPALRAEEAKREWDALRRWVEQLRIRYPNLVRLPECWWRHNDLVEVLSALRDHERACFNPLAPATAAVEWQRALRDMEIRMEIWIKRFTCNVPGRCHETQVSSEDVLPDGWMEHVTRDVARRRRPDEPSTDEPESPTPDPSQ